ncbi:hypothetical protein NW762_006704 [Fusarium torreyae]|uniref:J domain-containing protein n=1 Tax=Fusarium torreyae TaxID=1237075 RepID=A0A9W8S1X1_9HYPO|nr:hypothetical protein NW762_006704 [Fusarium torreyae]
MSTQTPDPYKILGVSKDAQLPEIRSAHRKLVLKCHPDKVQDPTLKAQKQDEFQRVQTAYELLADEKERKRYDDQAKLSELREQLRAKTAASASSRPSAAASPSSSRPTPTSTAYEYKIHTNDRTYKVGRQASPSRGYSYSRSYEEDHPRAADIFDGVRTVRREKSYQGTKTSSKRDEREREKEREREREKEYERELREREKEKERERERRRRADEAIRRAEKEAKEARRAEKKTRDKSRKRDTEEKKRHTKPYIETYDGESVPKSDKKKSSKKHDERRDRDRSSHREEVPPTTSSMHPPPIPSEYQDKANAALSYIQASRNKGSYTARHVQPPAPTPPPPGGSGSPFAAPDEDDVRRSSAKPRRGSTGEKGYNKPEVLDDPIEATPRPAMYKSATSTGAPTSSPPRRDLPRTSTMPTEAYGRHVPGISRAQTFSGAYPEVDPRGRGRTRMQSQIPESDSEDEYERLRRERKAHRSKKHRSPESRGEHVMQYRVDAGRATLQNSYSRNTESAEPYSYYSQTGARVVERPSMSREASYSAGYGAGAKYPKVKTSSYGDVQYSEYPYREATYA